VARRKRGCGAVGLRPVASSGRGGRGSAAASPRTCEHAKHLVDLQQLVRAARSPALLLGAAVEHVALALDAHVGVCGGRRRRASSGGCVRAVCSRDRTASPGVVKQDVHAMLSALLSSPLTLQSIDCQITPAQQSHTASEAFVDGGFRCGTVESGVCPLATRWEASFASLLEHCRKRANTNASPSFGSCGLTVPSIHLGSTRSPPISSSSSRVCVLGFLYDDRGVVDGRGAAAAAGRHGACGARTGRDDGLAGAGSRASSRSSCRASLRCR
jgi:hypothetical protein